MSYLFYNTSLDEMKRDVTYTIKCEQRKAPSSWLKFSPWLCKMQ